MPCPEFSDTDIQKIMASLPAGVDARKLELLPQIMRDWASVELAEYLPQPDEASPTDRSRRLAAVRKHALKLRDSLGELFNHDEQFFLVRQLLAIKGTRDSLKAREAIERRLVLCSSNLAEAAGAAATVWKKGRGQPFNKPSALVMRDIVALFEWLTGEKATRRTNAETDKPEGPVWNFAVAVWPIIFGSSKGLASAVRNHAAARRNGLAGTRSPLLDNIDLRHREWRIFD